MKELNKNQIMARKRKNLSNRMDGSSDTIVLMNKEKNISEGIANHFTVFIVNKNTDTPVRVALIPANFDTKRVVEGVLKYDNTEEINKAGFPVGAVLCEGTYVDDAKKINVLMQSADPARTIRHLLDYIKLNPTRIKSLEIVSDDANAFDTNMILSFVNPFFKNAEQTIDLSTFYDLYQEAKDRIRIDFKGNEVELSDISLLLVTIPADTKMKFIFRF